MSQDVAFAEAAVQSVLHAANTGIHINGPNPWDPQVQDPRFYTEVLQGSLGVGRAFVHKYVTCRDRPELIRRLLTSDVIKRAKRDDRFDLSYTQVAEDGNVQSRELSKRIGPEHYDYTPLVTAMIGACRVYTCAYYDRGATTLEHAQLAKNQLICEKIGLAPGHTVLDIGCGYGTLLKHMHTFHRIKRGVGISLSEGQLSEARAKFGTAPLEFRFQDYRDLAAEVPDQFDRIVSVGMIEHVGVPNLPEFFRTCRHVMKEDGLMLAHLITDNDPTLEVDPFTDLIFPGYDLPTQGQLLMAAEQHFVVEDVHNLNVNYAKTLAAWAANLRASWDDVKAKVGEELCEMFLHYLESGQGSFAARTLNVCQFVLSPHGVNGGYRSIR